MAQAVASRDGVLSEIMAACLDQISPVNAPLNAIDSPELRHGSQGFDPVHEQPEVPWTQTKLLALLPGAGFPCERD